MRRPVFHPHRARRGARQNLRLAPFVETALAAAHGGASRTRERTADAGVEFNGLGLRIDGRERRLRDVGWALRIVPNQLYYAFFVPVAWWLFFSPSYATYASTSSFVQARR